MSANWDPLTHARSVFRPGHNCWRVAHAHRAAFLIDADAYFRAFTAAVERAQHSIIVIGWDIDSRTRLLPEAHPRNMPTTLGAYLDAIVARRRGLHAYLLGWDYALWFALERELMPLYKLGTRTHRRVHFALDDTHPMTGSHHQKIVIVDDLLAFSGGLDLTIRRWDTNAHSVDDPLRVDPFGVPYKPFHDVQMMVDGPAARALAEIARQRWHRATGETLEPVRVDNACDPWPIHIKPHVADVGVAIARTQPKHNGYNEIYEVKQLYLDTIAAAQRHIYIENQYFTSDRIGAALSARLQEPQGPEIVIVLPFGNSGWLEENTMGLLRARIMRELKHADRYGRLRIYHVAIHEPSKSFVQIHSKVMVVDDHILRIGSSNLNNRSMGYDTECDLAIEARNDPRLEIAIAQFRNELLAEHLGTSVEAVAQAHAQTRSLIGAIEQLRGGAHSLEPLAGELANDVTVPEVLIIDPERPVLPEELIVELVPEDVRKTARHRYIRHIALLVILLGVAAAWRWTPLAQWLDLDTITAWSDRLSAHPFGPLAVILAYALGALIVFPVTLLIIATALSFDPLPSFLYALTGCLASALVSYQVGRLLGRKTLKRLAGPRLQRLNHHLVKRGLITMITVRLVPIAPFSVVNMVAGALRIRLRDLFLGSAIGMTPGILAITAFTGGIETMIREPSMKSLTILAGVALAIAVSALWLRRWLAQPERDETKAARD